MQIFLTLLVCLSLIPVTCQKILNKLTKSQPDIETFAFRGEIVSMNTQKHYVTLRHEEISNLQPKGTTELWLKNSRLMSTLKVGATVEGVIMKSKQKTWIETIHTLAQEPNQGRITTLLFFDEEYTAETKISAYTINNLERTNQTSRVGAYSLHGSWGTYGGLVLTLVNTDSVFWFQPNSRIQFWTRTDSKNNAIRVWATMHGGTLYLVSDWYKPAEETTDWYLVDIAVPQDLRNIPMGSIEIGGPGVQHTRFIDDLKITNVRLHGGLGSPPVAAMDYISLSQLGYIPGAKKEFSSPLDFESFDIVRVNDDSVVFRGGSSVGKLNSNLIAIPSATIYFGDFSSFNSPGRYKIRTTTMESLPFSIDSNVFTAPLFAAQKMFYYQRAFTAVQEPFAEKYWTHPSDEEKAPLGVVKGWHDAGDLSIYMPTMAQTLYWLLKGYDDFRPTEDNTNIPESGNGTPDLLDETRWGLEWVISMQDDNVKNAGGFWGTACVGCNNKDQGYGYTTPNTVSQYCKVHPPTVQNTTKAVAVLAYASVLFEKFDVKFSQTCLEAAKNGWLWMAANPQSIEDRAYACDAYAQGGDATLLKTNRSWAHASLFLATDQKQYDDAFLSDYVPTDWISSYSKTDGFANATYLRARGGNLRIKEEIRNNIFRLADAVQNDANNHPFRFATHYYWGSNSNALHRTGQFSWQAFLLDTTRTLDRTAGLNNLHYIFGRNFLNICYVSGGNNLGSTRARREGFHHWMKALSNPEPFYHFPGALAGGPNESPDVTDKSYEAGAKGTWGYHGDIREATSTRISNIRDSRTPLEGRFTDNDSWSTNEIAINWNAVLVYNLLAAKNKR